MSEGAEAQEGATAEEAEATEGEDAGEESGDESGDEAATDGEGAEE